MYNQTQMVIINSLSKGWVESDSQDNTLATATKAAETGKKHIITGQYKAVIIWQ